MPGCSPSAGPRSRAPGSCWPPAPPGCPSTASSCSTDTRRAPGFGGVLVVTLSKVTVVYEPPFQGQAHPEPPAWLQEAGGELGAEEGAVGGLRPGPGAAGGRALRTPRCRSKTTRERQPATCRTSDKPECCWIKPVSRPGVQTDQRDNVCFPQVVPAFLPYGTKLLQPQLFHELIKVKLF